MTPEEELAGITKRAIEWRCELVVMRGNGDGQAEWAIAHLDEIMGA